MAAALVRDLDVRVSFVCGGVERREEDVARLAEERPHILVASPGHASKATSPEGEFRLWSLDPSRAGRHREEGSNFKS